MKEYVRVYLGDTKQTTEFAKQFLEKRSKWRSAQRPQAQADDLCKPAPAVNPNASAEFQEVKVSEMTVTLVNDRIFHIIENILKYY